VLFARALLAVVLLSTLASCGDERPEVVSDGDGAPKEQATIELGFREAADDAAEDEAIAVLRRRLDGLGIEEATVEPDGDGITVRYPESSGLDPATVGGLLADQGELSFRAVLASTPQEIPPGCDDPGDADPDTTTRLPEVDASGSTIVCHELAPAALSGSIVASARAVEDGVGSWVVELELRPGPTGLDAFNGIAASCFERRTECPTGQVAVVLDDRVVSAPSIQAPSFEADGISIAGNFTPADAERLAIVLRSGALPVGLEVLETEEGG
jgi:preprotein translocase subunit SecD